MTKENKSLEFFMTPWKHQLEAIERAKDLDSFALFFEVGTGKTSTMINILRQKMKQEKRFLRTLILCPQIVIENWVQEFRIHSRVPHADVVPLRGPANHRKGTVTRTVDYPRIYVTNYETLQMESVMEKLKAMDFDCIILDESHRCKNFKSKRAKEAFSFSKNCKYRFILTGTPILNSVIDIFMQYKILDQGKTFGLNFYEFRNKYFTDKNAGFKNSQKYFPAWTVKVGAYSEITEKIAPSSMHVKKSECLDLPPYIKKKCYVEMCALQWQHYLAMKKDFITYVEDKACVATLAMTKALRLMQIVSGHMPIEGCDEGVELVTFRNDYRKQGLIDLLEAIAPTEKIIIWACFKENYKAIRSALEEVGIKYTEVHGDIPPRHKDVNVNTFNKQPWCRAIIANPQACGTGVNLTAASYSIYYSRNFSLEQDLQSEARNYRGGSEIHQKVTRIDIVTKGTIDEIILKKLHEKSEIGEKVLGDLKDILKSMEGVPE